MKNENLIVSQRIKFLRSVAGWSQQDLAVFLGITQTNYSLIEKGKVALKESYAAKLGEIFEVNPEWIKKGGDKPIVKNSLFIQLLPSRRVRYLPKQVVKRKASESMEALRKYFGIFIKDNMQTNEYDLAEASIDSKIYLFNLRYDKIMVLAINHGNDYIATINDCISEMNMIVGKKISLKPRYVEDISSGGLNSIISLLKAFKLDDERIDGIADEIAAMRIRSMAMQKFSETSRLAILKRICEEIVSSEIKLSEIAECLREMNRSDLAPVPNSIIDAERKDRGEVGNG